MEINQYFPKRHKKYLSPQPNINYPEGEIDILKTSKECDVITNAISSMIPEKLKPVSVFVTNPLFGEQIISFLSHPDFDKVYTYTADHDLIPYLVNNLELYNLTKKCVINDDAFNGVPKNKTNTVLYSDLSWVDPDEFNLFEINNQKLEYWIELSKHCALISMNIPNSVYIRNIPGFVYSIDQGTEVNKIYYIIPISTKDWKYNLQTFIFDFLYIVERDKQKRKQFVTPQNMKIWASAFTHESYDRLHNYEDLEKIGDSLLSTYFVLYLVNKYPNLDKEQLTNLQHYYLSEKYLPTLTRRYEFVRHIRTSSRLKPKVFEDIFESFFGALFVVANNINKNSGFNVAQKLANYMFDNIEVDVSAYGPMQSDHKSFMLKKVFDRLLKEHQPIETTTQEGSRFKTVITVDYFTYQYFKDLHVNLNHNRIIGIGYGNVKKSSTRSAWENTYRYFLNLGVNEEFVNKLVEVVKYKDIRGYEEVRRKYQKEGFAGIKIDKDIDAVGSFLQLLATKDLTQKYKTILAEISYSGKQDNADEYAKLFDVYLQS